MRARRPIAAALLALLLLASAAVATANHLSPRLEGKGKNLEFEVGLNAEGVPGWLKIDLDWVRCPNSYAPMGDRVYRELDSTTADTVEHRSTYAEREAGYLHRVKAHFVGRRVGEGLWEGRYETFVRVFYKGQRIYNCSRDKREAQWRARQLP